MQDYNPIIVGGGNFGKELSRAFGEILAKEAGLSIADTPNSTSLHDAVTAAPGMMETYYRTVRKAAKTKRKAQKTSRRNNRK